MSLYNVINRALIQSGQPEDVSQIVANLDAIATILNGNLDNSNLNAGAAIVQSKLAFDNWQNWTPILTGSGGNPTPGNSSFGARYVQIGKTVLAHCTIILGSSWANGVGNIECSLPVASVGGAGTSIGKGTFIDVSATGTYFVSAEILSASKANFRYNNVGTSFTWTYAAPVAPANTDQIQVEFVYEAA